MPISPMDEFLAHQTCETFDHVFTSDRNFYDRYFFNGYARDGSVFFGAAFGVYPHLNIMDGAFSVLKDGVQYSVHLSRILHHERMDTRVGPMKIDVLQPLHSVKITLDGAEGISGELTFEGRHFPVEEPRFQRRSLRHSSSFRPLPGRTAPGSFTPDRQTLRAIKDDENRDSFTERAWT